MIYRKFDLLSRAKKIDGLVSGFCDMDWTESPTLNEVMALDQLKQRKSKIGQIVVDSFSLLGYSAIKPYDKVLLVTPGNGYLSTIEAICLQLVLCPVELKVVLSSRDTFGRAFVDYITPHIKEDDCIFSVHQHQSHEEKLYFGSKFEPQLAVLYGSNETCWTWRHRIDNEAIGGCEYVVYGSKTSIAYDRHPYGLNELVRSYAEDFFSYDGTGCLNTSCLYVRISDDDDKHQKEMELLHQFAQELSQVRSDYIPHFQGYETYQSTLSSLMHSDSVFSDYHGVFIREPIRSPILAGGHGTAMIVPVTGIEAIEWEWQGHERDLSSATLYPDLRPFPKGDQDLDKLFDLGCSRVTKPGFAQRPSYQWRHDGMRQIPSRMYREVSYDEAVS